MDPLTYVEQATLDYRRYMGVEVVLARIMHSGRQNTIIYVEDSAGVRSCVRYRTAVEFWYEECIKEPFVESLGVVDLPRVRFALDTVRPQILICEFVEGRLLHDILVDADLAAKVGKMLAQVHVPTHGASNYIDFVAGRRSATSWSTDFALSLQETALACGYDRLDVARLLDKCAPAIAATDSNPLVLVHNDVHFKNMILRANGSVCLLDWDSASVAPAEKDFVKLMDWSHHNAAAMQSIRLAYQKKSGKVLDDQLIELFRVFAILRQVLFQSRSVTGGVDKSTLSQGGFFPESAEQRERLKAPLARLGLPPWTER